MSLCANSAHHACPSDNSGRDHTVGYDVYCRRPDRCPFRTSHVANAVFPSPIRPKITLTVADTLATPQLLQHERQTEQHNPHPQNRIVRRTKRREHVHTIPPNAQRWESSDTRTPT